MSEHRHDDPAEWTATDSLDERRSPAERTLREQIAEGSGIGKPIDRQTAQRSRTVESYLKGEVLPRYVTRAAQIEKETLKHVARLGDAHAALRALCAVDPDSFEKRWSARVAAWDFAVVNDLVADHNRYYPMERDLAMDPRTGDYVLVGGRSYRREPLGPEWALRRFPASRST